jgi:hypothetical protein
MTDRFTKGIFKVTKSMVLEFSSRATGIGTKGIFMKGSGRARVGFSGAMERFTMDSGFKV